eukprot:jgi/Phyca11/536853/estExt2_fgenesh1_pg.C_PHYCAscaffold_650031
MRARRTIGLRVACFLAVGGTDVLLPNCRSGATSMVSDEEAPTPLDDCEYPVTLGQSLLDTEENEDEQPQSSVFTSFGYEFQPASVDKSTPGLVGVDGSNGVQVLMGSSTGAPGGVSFKGKVVEHKETDCLLIFDGSGFRLERCPFSCMQLRHVRAPTPRRSMKIQSKPFNQEERTSPSSREKEAKPPSHYDQLHPV